MLVASRNGFGIAVNEMQRSINGFGDIIPYDRWQQYHPSSIARGLAGLGDATAFGSERCAKGDPRVPSEVARIAKQIAAAAARGDFQGVIDLFKSISTQIDQSDAFEIAISTLDADPGTITRALQQARRERGQEPESIVPQVVSSSKPLHKNPMFWLALTGAAIGGGVIGCVIQRRKGGR